MVAQALYYQRGSSLVKPRVQVFTQFVADCRAIGINVPIVPGIMVIQVCARSIIIFWSSRCVLVTKFYFWSSSCVY